MMPSKTYDVFLSHNSADKPAVGALAHKLKEAGLQPWFDKWDLVPGTLWQPALAAGLAASKSVAVFVGPSGVGPWEDAETMTALDRAFRERAHRVIPVLLPGSPASSQIKLPSFLHLFTWVDFRKGLDDPDALRRLIAGIRGEAPGSGERVEGAGESKQKPPDFRLPKLPNWKFDSRMSALDLIDHVAKVLDTRVQALRDRGISIDKITDSPNEQRYRFVVPGGQQYYLVMVLGGAFGPDTIGFMDGWGRYDNVMPGWTATGSMEWDRDSQTPVVNLINFSLLTGSPSARLSKEALAEGIWDKICTTIERLA